MQPHSGGHAESPPSWVLTGKAFPPKVLVDDTEVVVVYAAFFYLRFISTMLNPVKFTAQELFLGKKTLPLKTPSRKCQGTENMKEGPQHHDKSRAKALPHKQVLCGLSYTVAAEEVCGRYVGNRRGSSQKNPC